MLTACSLPQELELAPWAACPAADAAAAVASADVDAVPPQSYANKQPSI